MLKNKKIILGLISIAVLITQPIAVFAAEFLGNLDSGISTGINATLVSDPVATPAAGSYTSTQSVTLAVAGANSIRYTIDGTDPSCTTGTVYSAPISFSATRTIKSIACYLLSNSSSVTSSAYTITLAAPTASPAAGTYSTAQSVTLTTPATALSVRYTDDGTEPTCASTAYSGAISISSTKTVKAIACYLDGNSSAASSNTYTISGGGGGGGGGGGSSTTVGPTDVSVLINSNAASTNSTNVVLTIAASNATQMMISNETDFSGAAWEALATSKNWTLIGGDGAKVVYAKFKDSSSNVSNIVSDSIILSGSTSTAPVSSTTTTPVTTPIVMPGMPGQPTTGTTPAPTTPSTTQPQQTQVTIQDNDIVKASGQSALYLILNGKRHVIPHISVYNSWGYPTNFSTVKTVSASILNQYAEGNPVPFRDGYIFRGKASSLYGLNSSAVFVVSDGKLRPVASSAVYHALFDDPDWKLVTWVPDDLLTKFSYPMGAILDSSTVHPNGSLVQYIGSKGTVYLIDKGQKRGFASYSAFAANRYVGKTVYKINATETYTDGANITVAETALLTPVIHE